jgi:hypothetical protein
LRRAASSSTEAKAVELAMVKVMSFFAHYFFGGGEWAVLYGKANVESCLSFFFFFVFQCLWTIVEQRSGPSSEVLLVNILE